MPPEARATCSLLTVDVAQPHENNDQLTTQTDKFTLAETRISVNHPRTRSHSPAALGVEEQDEVELLLGFVLHLFSDAEHVRGGHGDGHPVVLTAHMRHAGVDDLHGGREELPAHQTVRCLECKRMWTVTRVRGCLRCTHTK